MDNIICKQLRADCIKVHSLLGECPVDWAKNNYPKSLGLPAKFWLCSDIMMQNSVVYMWCVHNVCQGGCH